MMKTLSFVCAGATALFAFLAQAKTVAYWPMVLDPETGGTSRMIADASGNGYDLKVALSDAQAANTEVIPFAYPPNGPSDVTISSCAEILEGTKVTVNAFERGTSATQTVDPLILAMGLCHDFTIEGYMYVKSMKHAASNADTIIAFSGMSGTGDWIWNLTEPTKDSNTRNVVVTIRGNGSKVENGGVLTTIADDEILMGWHHYALVFKFNVDGSKSQWTFYLDGVNRGSRLMANHDASTNAQQDRFLLGGANSGSHKVFDAKFAFWRVSDEALSSNAMLCHRTFETVVAYWPMNVYTNASERIVPDVVDERNTLLVRDPSKGGVSWTDNDISWTTPPNPDAELAAAGIVCPSRMMVRSGNNTNKIGNQYRPVFSTAADAPVLDATKLTKGFTIEGFLKFTTLPASDKNQMLVYNTYAEKGGWVWNLYGPDESGTLSMKVTYQSVQGSRQTLTLCDQIRPEDLLNVWNHCALTFTPDNGNAQTEWRFYLNGRLLGNDTTMPAYVDYEFTDPKFYVSGAPTSGAGQSILGDMTCWRVSNKALKPSAFLCGGEFPVIPADAFAWKGTSASGEWSTGDVANWDADGAAVAWTDGKDAYFDDSFVRNDIAIVDEVNPASITALDDLDLKIMFRADATSSIGKGCTNIVKRGLGTLEFSYGGNKVVQLLKGNCPIEVREGCLKVTAANSNGALGDASRGYEVTVCENARLWINGRNAIGSASPDVANDSVFTICTNGAFDISCSGFTIQALGALDLLGGDFIAPNQCHGYGYLMVRNRLTLGHRPDLQPYVFPAVLNNNGNVTGGISIGRNTEFRVEDVTGDAASDGVFDCAVLARTCDNWQTEQDPCGFRKTGTGTMELNGTYLGGSDLARPSGAIAVEAGELKVNIDYRGPSKYTVAGGAYLSGTGKVTNVEFAAGAGVRVDAAKTDLLELADVDFAGSGVIELAGVAPDALEKLNAKCAKITGAVTGAANLANWKVKVDGTEVPDLVVRASGGYLKAGVARGLVIVVQ